MLLAVFDLARGGGLTENKVVFDTPLLERYSRFFEAVRTPTDHPNPYFPFLNLAGKLRAEQYDNSAELSRHYRKHRLRKLGQ